MAKAKWFHQIRGDMPSASAAEEVIQARISVVAARAPLAGALGMAEPEHVHQLRVATRRAGAALEVFRCCLRRKDARRLKRMLRRLRRAAAEARELDVHRQMLQASKHALGGSSCIWNVRFDELLLGRRLKVQRRLRRGVEKHIPRLQSRAAKAITQMQRTGQTASGPTVDSIRARELDRAWQAVRQTSAAGLDDLDRMHQLRIAVKRLRYAMEIFAGCYGPKFTQELYPQVKSMQSVLGAVNDWNMFLESFRGTSRRLGRGLKSVQRRQLDGWVNRMNHHARAELQRRRQDFLQLWEQSVGGELDKWQELMCASECVRRNPISSRNRAPKVPATDTNI